MQDGLSHPSLRCIAVTDDAASDWCNSWKLLGRCTRDSGSSKAGPRNKAITKAATTANKLNFITNPSLRAECIFPTFLPAPTASLSLAQPAFQLTRRPTWPDAIRKGGQVISNKCVIRWYISNKLINQEHCRIHFERVRFDFLTRSATSCHIRQSQLTTRSGGEYFVLWGSSAAGEISIVRLEFVQRRRNQRLNREMARCLNVEIHLS